MLHLSGNARIWEQPLGLFCLALNPQAPAHDRSSVNVNCCLKESFKIFKKTKTKTKCKFSRHSCSLTGLQTRCPLAYLCAFSLTGRAPPVKTVLTYDLLYDIFLLAPSGNEALSPKVSRGLMVGSRWKDVGPNIRPPTFGDSGKSPKQSEPQFPDL